MDSQKKLNRYLLNQLFDTVGSDIPADYYKQIAIMYACVENSLAVLSDMKTNSSYIYYGGMCAEFGLQASTDSDVIPSIWEKSVLERIHPDDLERKYLDEMQFYNFIKSHPRNLRHRFYLRALLRMRNTNGFYIPVVHRMFYLSHGSDESMRYALCLYNRATIEVSETAFIDTVSGRIHYPGSTAGKKLLTDKEKEVLRMIADGCMSKHIADNLSVSIHTVNRHRQNILRKLQAGTSMEACSTARRLKLI